MSDSISTELQKIEDKKRKLQIQEKLLKEKEKQKRARRFSLIGKIASKADIDHLDDETLLGAFLEISSHLPSKEKQDDWKNKGKSFVSNGKETDGTPLSISFSNDPKPETKKILKDLGFRWNSFRKEFYGYGRKDQIRQALSGVDFKIEVID